jgi:hypothetical protein
VLEGVRLSELARCPRMCALRAVGAEPEPIAPEWQRFFTRGQLFEHYVAELYAAEDGRENVRRQLVVRWPLGEGHADIYRTVRRELIEVKSTTAPDGAIFETAVRQVRLYKHFFTPAKRAGVYLVNPSDLRREDFIPVTVSSSDTDEIVSLVRSVETAIESDGAELPPCSAENPAQCRRLGCAFTAQAWEDWQPPTVELEGEEAAALVISREELKRDYRKFCAEADERKKGYSLVQTRLAEIGVEPGRDYLIAGRKLRRIVSAESDSFSLAKARTAGSWNGHDDERFAPFIKPRAGSERWSVDRIKDGEPSGDDFGKEAPF